MKPPTHPIIMAISIILAASISGLGAFFVEEHGDPRCLLIGFAFSLVVWVGIIIDRGRRSVTVFHDEAFLLDNEPLLLSKVETEQ